MSINISYIKEFVKDNFYKFRYDKFFSYMDKKNESFFLESSDKFINLSSFKILKKNSYFDLNFIIKKMGLDEKSKIIFYLNGYYYKSFNLPKEITFINFSNFDENIFNYLKLFYNVDKSNIFVNDIFYNEGCYIYIPSGVIIEEPVFVVNLFDGFTSKSIGHLNNLYVLGKGSSINLMEFYYNKPLDLSLNIKNLIYLNDYSIFNYCFFNNLNLNFPSFFYFSGIQKSNSVLQTEFYNFYNNCFYSSLYFNIFGSCSETYLNMAKISKLDFMEDINVYIKHFVPNSKSNIKFRGLAKDISKISFRGIIDVSKFAYKTDSSLKCDGLLLSDGAIVDLCPELIINNNDVKCTHGATIGNMSKLLLYYMMSRGIHENESIILLVRAFLVPVMNLESSFFSIINKFLLEEF